MLVVASVVSALRASCSLRTEITSPKITCCRWQALQPPHHRSRHTASQASPHSAPGTLNICMHTLPGSIPILSTEGLPPPPAPLKASRLHAESLPNCGQLPAPKIRLVIRGATVLASICGSGAAAVTERGLPPGIGWLPIGACSPQSLRPPSKGPRGATQPGSPSAGEIRSHGSQGKFSSILECPRPVRSHFPYLLPQVTRLVTSKEEAWAREPQVTWQE